MHITIRHIFISPGHNFYGHNGQPPGENPIQELSEVEAVEGRGLRGDRFFGYRPDYKGQVTFFAWETLEAIRAEFKLPHVEPSVFRRNIVTRGIDLNALIGTTFELQGVRLEAVEECRPCYWMDRAVAPGAENWLKGRGGLRCRVLSTGWLRVGGRGA